MLKLSVWCETHFGWTGDISLLDKNGTEVVPDDQIAILSHVRMLCTTFEGKRITQTLPVDWRVAFLPFALFGADWDEGQAEYFVVPRPSLPKVEEALRLLNSAREICANLGLRNERPLRRS